MNTTTEPAKAIPSTRWTNALRALAYGTPTPEHCSELAGSGWGDATPADARAELLEQHRSGGWRSTGRDAFAALSDVFVLHGGEPHSPEAILDLLEQADPRLVVGAILEMQQIRTEHKAKREAEEAARQPTPRRRPEPDLGALAELHRARLEQGYGDRVIGAAVELADAAPADHPMFVSAKVLLDSCDGIGAGHTWREAVESATAWHVEVLTDPDETATAWMEEGPPEDPTAYLGEIATKWRPVEVLAQNAADLRAAVLLITNGATRIATRFG